MSSNETVSSNTQPQIARSESEQPRIKPHRNSERLAALRMYSQSNSRNWYPPGYKTSTSTQSRIKR